MSSDPFAVATVALAITFRSRLNFTDVSRKVGELVRPDGTFTCSESDVRGKGEFRLAAAIQIAIDQALAAPTVADRFRVDPGFAQMAVDAVYYIARRWQEEPGGVIDLSKGKLRDELISRMSSVDRPDPARSSNVSPAPTADPNPSGAGAPAPGADPNAAAPGTPAPAPPAPGPPAPKSADMIGDSELSALHEMIVILAGYLANFPELVRHLREMPPGDWPLADIIPPGVRGLLKRELAGKEFSYRFMLDELGRPVDGEPAQGWINSTLALEVTSVLAQLRGLNDLLSQAGLTVSDLRAVRALPESVSDPQVAKLLAQLEAASLDNILTSDRSQTISEAKLAALAIAEFRRPLEESLILTAVLKRDAGCSARDALAAAGRYFNTRDSVFLPPDREDLESLVNPSLPLDALARLHGKDDFLSGTEARKADMLVVDRRWTAWRDHLGAFFKPSLVNRPTAYDDMLLAASGCAPGTLFRTVMSEMTVVEWSRVVLAGLPGAPDPPFRPLLWALVGGLRALGFDGGLLLRLAKDDDWEWDEADRSAARAMAQDAPPRPAGVMHVYAEEDPNPASPPTLGAGKPILALGSADQERYMEGLGWLRSLGALEGRTHEKTEELRPLPKGPADRDGEPS